MISPIFTPRARRRLVEIAKYTIRRFGPAQARAYEDHLIGRVHRLTEGSPPHGRSCAVLMDGEADVGDLRFVLVLAPRSRRGHYIIFRERSDRLEILDFLSTDFNLPRHLEDLQKV
ncbi:MAG: type II toxin-antitoxin system RelE/ParE family toxin [Geminicoccaceae bacterium]